ncbi:MAG TPA: LptF/LptG family permease [Vicinamibacterales bacterium]|nr:LptF/LptG family permease [Vicinamibacterales bacterium]
MSRPPGARLRAIAARLCGAEAVEHVIDPALADFQIESDAAARDGRAWRCRRLRVGLSIALVQAVVACAFERLWSAGAAATDDEPVADAAVVTSIVGTAAALVLFTLPLLTKLAHVDWRLVVLVVPSAVPVALPIGLTFGLFVGRGTRGSARFTRKFVAIAILASTASFVMLSWIVPEANQMFRERAYSQFARQTVEEPAPRRPLARGTNELTIGMLRHEMRADALHRPSPATAFAYYQRWALPAASVVMALFALAATGRWPIGRFGGSMIALSSCLAYWLVLEGARWRALDGTWPVAAAAWLPNLLFMATTVTLQCVARAGAICRSRSG